MLIIFSQLVGLDYFLNILIIIIILLIINIEIQIIYYWNWNWNWNWIKWKFSYYLNKKLFDEILLVNNKLIILYIVSK